MSFLNIATSGLWSVLMLTSWVKQYWWLFFEVVQYTKGLSILLYQAFLLARHHHFSSHKQTYPNDMLADCPQSQMMERQATHKPAVILFFH